MQVIFEKIWLSKHFKLRLTLKLELFWSKRSSLKPVLTKNKLQRNLSKVTYVATYKIVQLLLFVSFLVATSLLSQQLFVLIPDLSAMRKEILCTLYFFVLPIWIGILSLKNLSCLLHEKKIAAKFADACVNCFVEIKNTQIILAFFCLLLESRVVVEWRLWCKDKSDTMLGLQKTVKIFIWCNRAL